MLPGQRLAVHAEGEDRVASVQGDLQRGADREAVDCGAEDLVGLVADAGPVEHVLQGYAEPAGRSDELAADLVAHAGQRDVVLDDVHLGQLVEGEADLLLDVAVDGELPGVDVDHRDGQVGVHPVEVPARSDERR